MRAKLINEAFGDVFKPRSKSDILNQLKNLEPEELFEQGLKHGILEAVKEAVEKHGIDPNGNYNDGYSDGGTIIEAWPLIEVIEREHEDIVQYLIDKGVSPNVKIDEDNMRTPLLVAIKTGNIKIFDILAKHINDLTFPNNWPFHKAAIKGNVNLVKKFLKDPEVVKLLGNKQTQNHPEIRKTSTLHWINRIIQSINAGIIKKVKIEDLLEIKKLIEDA